MNINRKTTTSEGGIGAPLLVANTIVTMFGITGPIYVLKLINLVQNKEKRQ